MSKKWKDRDLIRRALNEAFVNVEGLADSYNYKATEPVVIDAKEFIAAMDAYALRKYGSTISGNYADHMRRLAGRPGRVNVAGKWEPTP